MIQKTSLEAFEVIQLELGIRQQQVYDMLSQNPNVCNRELAMLLDWPINRVTPRIKELRDKGLVVCSIKKIDEGTRMKVMCWKVVC